MNHPAFLKGIRVAASLGMAAALGLAALLGIQSAASAASLSAANPSSSKLNSADRTFLINAARTDMIEAHEGQMAESQAGRPDVKDLGKKVADDHTHSYEQLSALAARYGVKIPKGINAARDREIALLTHLKGDQFDRTFSKDEITDHQRALAAFRRESASGHDPDVKAFATQTIPTLEKHLQLAKDCAAKHS